MQHRHRYQLPSTFIQIYLYKIKDDAESSVKLSDAVECTAHKKRKTRKTNNKTQKLYKIQQQLHDN